MADIRINALATTATTPASDDYLALDGAAQGTRKILATNIANNVTDVILGSSGPSVKSSLSARAPRQGLVFDGSLAEATFTIPAFGTSPYTVQLVARQTSAATQRVFWAAANGAFIVYVGSNGSINWGISGSATVATSAGVFAAGVNQDVVITRVSTAANDFKIYVNGVVVYTGTDANNYTIASNSLSDSTADAFSGTILGRVYNRALSASEVVALYEAGAPSGADYNSASNTAINTGFANSGLAYTTFSGASATGFTATSNGSGLHIAWMTPQAVSLTPGQRFLVTLNLTLNSGTAPSVSFGATPTVNNLKSNVQLLTAGANSFVLTATAGGTSDLYFYNNSTATNYSVSSVSVTRLGLLLAPDAAQAGGGLVWYDTSGNAANITLPASGVMWNVPTSGKIATNLAINGGTATVNGLSGGNATFSATQSSSSGYSLLELKNTGGTAQSFEIGVAGSGVASFGRQLYLYDATNSAIRLTVSNGGNLLLKSDGVDSANGKLQLATHTTSAGGIGFGTDTSLYRTEVGRLGLGHTSLPLFQLDISGNKRLQLAYVNGTTTGILATTVAGASLVLQSGNEATALTLSGSDQSATFAGTVSLSTTSDKAGLTLNFPAAITGSNGPAMTFKSWTNSASLINSGRIASTITDGSASYGSKLELSVASSGSLTTALTLFQDLAASFAGEVRIASGKALKLGNAYQAGAPTATGYVTIQDSTGTTYKVLVGT